MNEFDEWLDYNEITRAPRWLLSPSPAERDRIAAKNLAVLKNLLKDETSKTEPANGARDDE